MVKDSIVVPCKTDINSSPKSSTGVKQTQIKPTRDKDGNIYFSDRPDFVPNLTPKEIFHLGSFGGTYYRPIYSCVTKKSYKDVWKEFPRDWFPADIDTYVASETCNTDLNKYGKKSGTSLRTWEEKGWSDPLDPYGWIQWYCRFYGGRRSYDDDRQIDRFLRIAGEDSGRWRKNLTNKIIKKAQEKGLKPVELLDDYTISPTIRQLLQQWAFVLNDKNLK